MCWHKWTKWEQYVWTGEVRKLETDRIFPCEYHRQKRHCIKCGKEQNERIY